MPPMLLCFLAAIMCHHQFEYLDNQNQEQLNFVVRVAPGGLVYTV